MIANKPKGMTINIHVCRGNFHSTYFSSGPYDAVAEPLFGRENVNAYYLEYDDVRSGGFEPLKHVSGDKKVVLPFLSVPILCLHQNVQAEAKQKYKSWIAF